jgi:hypothetical protein
MSYCVQPDDINTTTNVSRATFDHGNHSSEILLSLLRWRVVYHAKDTLIQVMKVDMQRAVDTMITGFCDHLCHNLQSNIEHKLPDCFSKEAIHALAREHTNLWAGIETPRHETRAADEVLEPLELSVRVLGQKATKDDE